MFDFTTIIIISIFLIITYYIYQLLIDNLKMTKRLEDNFSNKVDEVFDKINETYNLVNKKTDYINSKIKELGEIELKQNELHILNNQKIVEKHIFQDEENGEVNSPITENFFIKHNENKDKELYYMSPINKTSNNSNIISITSKESLFKDMVNIDTLSQKISKSSELSKSSEKFSYKNDNDNINEEFYDNNMFNINLLNNNLNFLNIIGNKNENDSMRIKDEDRVEEL